MDTMTLTTDDLQAIGKIIDERLEVKLEEKLEQKFEEKLAPIKEELASHGKTLKYLKKKVNRIDKTLDIVARTYDQRLVANSREIDNIKDHLGLSSNY